MPCSNHSCLLAAAAILAAASITCASSPSKAPQIEEKPAQWGEEAKKLGGAAVRGGKAVGNSLGDAYKGVTSGFDDPDEDAFGRYPTHYAERIRKHFERFLDMPRNASYELSQPQKGHVNKGILLGGGVEWQGYLVDVDIALDSALPGGDRVLHYVVRMRDGEVIDVHDEHSVGVLRRN